MGLLRIKPAVLLLILFGTGWTTGAKAEEPPPPPPASVGESKGEPAINHPHLYFTPAGPTGYTLGRGETDIQLLPWNDFRGIDSWETGYRLSLADIKYGIFDALTLELLGGVVTLGGKARYNFLNLGRWSTTFESTYKTRFRDDYSDIHYPNDWTLALALAASYELNPRSHFHFLLISGRRSLTSAFDAYFYSSNTGTSVTYGYMDDSIAWSYRASAEFEFRFNHRHGINLWLGGQFGNSNGTESGTSTGTFSQTDTIVTGGLAYQYVRDIFWLMIGIEIGPESLIQDSNYSRFSIYHSYYPETWRHTYGNSLFTFGWRF